MTQFNLKNTKCYERNSLFSDYDGYSSSIKKKCRMYAALFIQQDDIFPCVLSVSTCKQMFSRIPYTSKAFLAYESAYAFSE